MTNNLSMLFAIIKTELRLLIRRLPFWVFLFSLSVLAIVVVFNTPDYNNWLDILVKVVNNLAFYQFPLLAILVAPAGMRNKHKRGEWLWTTPLQTPLLVLGQVSGLVLGVCAVLLVSSGLTWLTLVLRGLTTLSTLPIFCLFFLALMLPITLLELSITYSLVFLLGRVALAVLLAIGLSSLIWLGVLMPTASLLTPFNYTLLTLDLDSVAGFGAEKDILFPLLGFYVVFSILLFTVSTWGSVQKNIRVGWQPQNNRYIQGLLLVSVSFTLFVFYMYQLSVQSSIVPLPITEQIDTWRVTTVSSTGTITHTGIEIMTQLTLHNDSDQEQTNLVLALNTGLKVSEATINDRVVNTQRMGESIQLEFPSSSVSPDESVIVNILYNGVPQLLREDYVLVKDVKNGTHPTAFRRSAPVYLDRRVIYLQRDADWLIWPLSSGPHVAAQDAELTLTVSSNESIVSSGQVIDQNQSERTYYWGEPLPSFLLVAAPYHIYDQPGSSILIGAYGDNRDIEHAEIVLALQQVLNHRISVSDANGLAQAVILPYAQSIVVSNSVIGLPSGGQEWDRYGRLQKYEQYQYNIAVWFSHAWLTEYVAWPSGELDTAGQIRSSITICDRPDENNEQRCEVRSLGGVNPQAPYNRLVETANTSPLLQALSIQLGRLLVVDITGDTLFWEERIHLWSTPDEMDLEASSSNNLPFQFQQDKYPNQCQVIALVLAIEHLYNDLGDTKFTQMLQMLTKSYPIGGQSLTEENFWLVASRFTNNAESIRSQSLECSNYTNE